MHLQKGEPPQLSLSEEKCTNKIGSRLRKAVLHEGQSLVICSADIRLWIYLSQWCQCGLRTYVMDPCAAQTGGNTDAIRGGGGEIYAKSYARGAIPNEMGPTLCLAKPASSSQPTRSAPQPANIVFAVM